MEKDILLLSRLLRQVATYTETDLPFLSPKHLEFKTKLPKILYNLAYLKVGRANYLESQGRINGRVGSLNFTEGSRLRKEAEILVSLTKIETGVDLTEEVLLSSHQTPTGSHGTPKKGFDHF